MMAPVNRLSLVTLAVAALIAGCGGSGHPTSTGDATGAPTTTPTATAGSTAPPTTVTGQVANIKVYGDCRTPTVMPTQIVMACADHGELFVNLRWSGWASDQAAAVGTFRYNDCTPNCANGHFHEVPNVHVTLSAPVRGANRGLVWSRLQMRPTVDPFPSVQSLPVGPD